MIKDPLRIFAIQKRKNNESKKITLKLSDSKFLISFPTYDWNIPLKQRPQHIAESIAKTTSFAYVFCSINILDNLRGLTEVKNNLYLSENFWKIARMSEGIHVYATDPTLTLKTFKRIEKLNKPIIYEMLDEIDSNLQGGNSTEMLKRHKYAIKSQHVKLIITTALSMAEQIPSAVKHKVRYVPNACDPEHFYLQDIPTTSPIIGYFGALASWFDYDLVQYCAQKNPHWTVVLIGSDYDGSLRKSTLLKLPNVKYRGVVEHQRLPNEIPFHVSIIPFVLNNITNATSPVKAFEYLASGFPVVSTPLPECQNIPEIAIGKTKEEFEEQIKEAIMLDSLSRRKKRRDFALKQTWDSRAFAYSQLSREWS